MMICTPSRPSLTVQATGVRCILTLVKAILAIHRVVVILLKVGRTRNFKIGIISNIPSGQNLPNLGLQTKFGSTTILAVQTTPITSGASADQMIINPFFVTVNCKLITTYFNFMPCPGRQLHVPEILEIFAFPLHATISGPLNWQFLSSKIFLNRT